MVGLNTTIIIVCVIRIFICVFSRYTFLHILGISVRFVIIFSTRDFEYRIYRIMPAVMRTITSWNEQTEYLIWTF